MLSRIFVRILSASRKDPLPMRATSSPATHCFTRVISEMTSGTGRRRVLLPLNGDTLQNSQSKWQPRVVNVRSEEHTSELQSLAYIVFRLLLERKNTLVHPPVHFS